MGLVADPAAPTEMAHRLSDLDPPDGDDDSAWVIEVVSEPFTTGSEDVDTALERLTALSQTLSIERAGIREENRARDPGALAGASLS